MINLKEMDSVAFFGSAVRGDNDLLSDYDVLLVGNESHRQFSKAYSLDKGYSPSFYNWEQFGKLIEEKSLFIQHLKQESSIILDKDERLTKLLNTFKVGTNYSARLLQNNLLLNLTACTPLNNITHAWAFDVLAVAFRNFAILKNAQKGDFIFGYSELVQRITSQYNLSQFEANLLLELRRDKSLYRSGKISTIADTERLNITQHLLASLLGVSWGAELKNFYEFSISNLTKYDSYPWYFRIRWYEGVYRATGRLPINASTKLEYEIEWIFANPSPYGYFDDRLIQRLPLMIASV